MNGNRFTHLVLCWSLLLTFLASSIGSSWPQPKECSREQCGVDCPMHRVVAEVKPCCKKDAKTVASTLCKCPKKDALATVLALAKPTEPPPLALDLPSTISFTLDQTLACHESVVVIHNHGPPVESPCVPPPSRGPPCLM